MTFRSWLHRFFAPDSDFTDTPENNLSAGKKPHILTVNKKLSEYLDNYVATNNECPEFAVGIYGDWGIGKTFFIQEWLEYHNINHCYLSLFGISSTDDIEKAIFKTEHPILSSPALQATLEVASVLTQNNGLSEKFPPLLNALNGELKKLNDNLPQHVETLSNKTCSRPILVFDDIERTSLPYPVLFGYLSMLSQSRHYKIILLYNRDKLAQIYNKQRRALNRNKTFFQSFQDLFQKSVGIEFLFKGDFEDALQTIFAQHTELLNTSLFIEIIQQTGNNLRRVKQTLWQFKNCWAYDSLFSSEQKQAIFSVYLATSCTFFDPTIDQITQFAARLSTSREPNFYSQYNIPSNFECPLSPHLIALLIKQNTEQNDLHRQIREFVAATNNKEDFAWRTLMNSHFINKNQLYEAIKIIRSRLKSSEHQEVGELLHIVGLSERLKNELYIDEDTAYEMRKLVSAKLQAIFDKDPESLSFLTESDLNHLSWGGYGIPNTKTIRVLHDKFLSLLQNKRTDNFTAALSSNSPNFEQIRDLIQNKKISISKKLCEKNISNFVRLLSQWDTCAQNLMFAEFFMKEMQHQHMDAKAFFSDILNKIKSPSDQGFDRGRYLFVQEHLKYTLMKLYPEDDSNNDTK